MSKYRADRTEQPPRYLSTTEGWVSEERDDAYVKIVAIKVWSYQQYNECKLLVGGPGQWREAKPEEMDNLSGFEKGLVFEAKPRQGKDGRPPVFVVRSAVRMVDDYIAGIASPYATSPLNKADWSFNVPVAQWDAFVAHVRDKGGTVSVKSVQWTDVEKTFADILAVVENLSEITAQESRVSGQPAEMMAAYARLATQARQAVDRLGGLTSELVTLKESLDEEPERFEEKVRLSTMVEQARGHYEAFKDMPARLHSKSQSPPSLLAKRPLPMAGRASAGHDACWTELAVALQKAYPDAAITVGDGLVIARVGQSLLMFTSEEIRSIIV